MSLLITTSLLDSVSWAAKAPDTPCAWNPEMSWKQDAYVNLKNTLGRVWSGGNAAMERGMRFESTIAAIVNSGRVDTVKCSPLFKEVLDKCVGGTFQKKTKSFIEVNGEEYCLFGKIDVFFKNRIVDIKTTKEYKGRSKYLGTMQHKIYCHNEHIDNFEYVIAEFTDEDGDTLKSVHTVPYVVENFDSVKEDIVEAIVDLRAFLEQFPEKGDLQDLYLHKFSMFN